MQTQTAKKNELMITRVFDAPRELVWKAWTDPEMVKKWWGPKGYSAPFYKADLRVGGKYLTAMRDPEGKDIWSTGVYREVDPPSKLVVTDSFSDKHGNVVPASCYGMEPDFPMEAQISVTFEDQGGKTKLTLHHKGFPGEETASMAKEGWNQSFDKLADYLKTL